MVAQRNGDNRGNNHSRSNQAKFEGAIDGLPKMQLPDEGGKPGQYSAFYKSFELHVKTSVSKHMARVWALALIRQDNSAWEPPFPDPPVAAKPSKKEDVLFESAVLAYSESISQRWPEAKMTMHATIMKQCSKRMSDHLQGLPFFNKCSDTNDCVTLLKHCQLLTTGGKLLAFCPSQRAKAIRSLANCKQLQSQSVTDYLQEFQGRLQLYQNLHGDLKCYEDTWTGSDGKKVSSKEALIVCLFIDGCDYVRFGERQQRLRDDASSKNIRYPSTLAGAYEMVEQWDAEGTHTKRRNPNSSSRNGDGNRNNNDDTSESVHDYLNTPTDSRENEICLTSAKYDDNIYVHRPFLGGA